MRASVLVPLIIFIMMVILLCKGLFLQPSIVNSPLINKQAPRFELPNLLTEKPITQANFLGHVTLLNVWASWCYACSTEHALLMQISDTVKIVGLNYKDTLPAAKKWLQEKGNPYSKIIYDKKGDTAIDFGVYGTPETFIIDQKGIIRYKHIGPISQELWETTLYPLIVNLDKKS